MLISHSYHCLLLLFNYLFLVYIPLKSMCFSFDDDDEYEEMVNSMTPYITDKEFTRAANMTADEFANENLDDPRKDPETKHKFFEGDMMVKRKKFKDIMFVPKMWPKARIPYEIEPHFTEREREAIAVGMLIIHRRTCVRFVPKKWYHINYVHIVKDRGCAAHVGKRGGEQFIILGRGCFSIGTVVHEMMHCLGFIHEQSRPDRDKYVNIYWDNIRKDRKREFRRHARDYFYENGFPYDLFSVMHYREYAFSRNGEKTIVAKNGVDLRCNGLECPTSLDIKKINHFYSCDKKKHGKGYEKYGEKLIKPPIKHKHHKSSGDSNKDKDSHDNNNNNNNGVHYTFEHKELNPENNEKPSRQVVQYSVAIQHDHPDSGNQIDDNDVQIYDNAISDNFDGEKLSNNTLGLRRYPKIIGENKAVNKNTNENINKCQKDKRNKSNQILSLLLKSIDILIGVQQKLDSTDSK